MGSLIALEVLPDASCMLFWRKRPRTFTDQHWYNRFTIVIYNAKLPLGQY